MTMTKWSQRGEEPNLEELLNDPIVELVMARDNLKADDVIQVVQKAKQHFDKKAA